MNILYFENFKNFEPNIISIINSYKDSIENYEKKFFLELPDYIDDKYLNIFYDCNLSLLFNNELSLNEKIKILNDNSLEIYDIQNIIAITIQYTNKKYYYKWNMFKSEIFESTLDTMIIRHLKHILLTSQKYINNKNNIIQFTIDELINISISNTICLHCITKDYIMSINEDNSFIEILKKKML